MRYCDYKGLKVWQKSMDLVIEIYNLTKNFPNDERYRLTDQMKRAVISVPSNIAEGHGRNSDKDFIKFLTISRGSLIELETQIEICRRLDYISDQTSQTLCNSVSEIIKMINSLIQFRNKEKYD